MFQRLSDAILETLLPPKCVLCRKLVKRTDRGICSDCREKYRDQAEKTPGNGPFSVVVSAAPYQDEVRKSIQRFKFRGMSNYAAPFGEMMAEAVRNHLAARYDLITWVPISAPRRRNRGYDQAMLLAYAVALELDDVAVETLQKTVDTPAQSGIQDPNIRKGNVRGAYEATDPSLIEGKRILLIDDIYTTGATLGECAGILLHAGAVEVVGCVFAKSGTGN